ncbi:hypothetical protein AOA81_00005, partial [Methanomassiliicoccales archaeon RumEn M2]
KLILMLDNKGYTLNLDAIWIEQRAPNELLNQLLDIAIQIRSKLQEEIEGTSRNLFDYCKSKDAWDKVRPIKIEFRNDINRWVISKKRENTQIGIARRAENDTAQIKNRIWVVEKTEEFWRSVMGWGLEHSKLRKDEISVLNVAVNMHSSRRPPSEKQCEWLKKIYDKLMDEGMEL